MNNHGCLKFHERARPDKQRGYFSRLFTKFNWWNNHTAAFGTFQFKEW